MAGLKTIDNLVKSEDLFTSLSKEGENSLDKKIEINMNKSLESIINGYERILGLKLTYSGEQIKDIFAIITPDNIDCKNILDFSILLNNKFINIKHDYLGLYLNSLIEKCKDNEIIIYTNHLGDNIDVNYLGYKNKSKNITIYGNAGNYLGYNMHSGKIEVFGNVKHGCGEKLENGLIHIHGDCGNDLGREMLNGEIIIDKNAEYYIGQNMRCGKIIIYGDCFIIGKEMINGEIIVYGNCMKNIGYNMLNGKIAIHGKTGENVGCSMRGGDIYLEGYFDYKNLPLDIFGGSIYHKGMPLIKDGKRIRITE